MSKSIEDLLLEAGRIEGAVAVLRKQRDRSTAEIEQYLDRAKRLAAEIARLRAEEAAAFDGIVPFHRTTAAG